MGYCIFIALFVVILGIVSFSPPVFADYYAVSIESGSSLQGCEETDSCYIPSSLVIDKGDEVTWDNNDSAAHTVTGGKPSDDPSTFANKFGSTSLIMAGNTFSHTFDQVGTYDYFCMVHPWKTGIVIVSENVTTLPPIEPTITVSTDSLSYYEGDTIRIFGEVSERLNNIPISLNIVSSTGDLVGISQIDVGFDNTYSTEMTAGGQLMDSTGTYTVNVVYGTEGSVAQTTFEYLGSEQPSLPPPTLPPPTQPVETILILNEPPSKVVRGQTIEFTGKLTDKDGNAIPAVRIEIRDDLPITQDKQLGVGTTDRTGKFRIVWNAEESKNVIGDPDNVILPFAEFKGYSQFIKSTSEKEKYTITITTDVTLTLDISGREFYSGDTVVFSGRLTAPDGSPISGAEVRINEARNFKSDKELLRTTTDSNGSFRATKSIQSVDGDSIIAVHALYQKGIRCTVPGNCIEGRSLLHQFAIIERDATFDQSKLILCTEKTDPFSDPSDPKQSGWLRAEAGILVKTKLRDVSGLNTVMVPFQAEAGKLTFNFINEETGLPAPANIVRDTPLGSDSYSFEIYGIPITIGKDSEFILQLSPESGNIKVHPEKLEWNEKWSNLNSQLSTLDGSNLPDSALIAKPQYVLEGKIEGITVTDFDIEKCDPNITVHFNIGDGVQEKNGSEPPLEPSPPIPTISVSTDDYQYSPSELVTIKVSTSKSANVAISVIGPSGDSIVSRSISTDFRGSGSLQFKLPESAQNGPYRVDSTATISGSKVSDSTIFTVKSTSVRVNIISVQPTDQQGNSVSSFTKGKLGFVKVVLSTDSSVNSLVTINLFDIELTSLGIGSFKTTLGSGQSEMILSFFIPNDSSSGNGDIYANIFSDWPSQGGIPLTGESSTQVRIQ